MMLSSQIATLQGRLSSDVVDKIGIETGKGKGWTRIGEDGQGRTMFVSNGVVGSIDPLAGRGRVCAVAKLSPKFVDKDGGKVSERITGDLTAGRPFCLPGRTGVGREIDLASTLPICFLLLLCDVPPT